MQQPFTVDKTPSEFVRARNCAQLSDKQFSARVTVREVRGRIEVFVASADPAAGLIISARAQELG